MKKKYLIISGCSFTTDINFRSSDNPDLDTSWPKWPELLAEKLNMECINLARSGQGNEYIYSTLQDEILEHPNKDEIGLVIAAWTQCQRSDWQIISPWLKRYHARRKFRASKTKTPEAEKTATWSSIPLDKKGDIVYWVRRSLRYFAAFEMMCERYNIPYLHTQMIGLFNDYLRGRIIGQEDFEYYHNDARQQADNLPQFLEKYRRENNEILKIMMNYDKILDTSKFIGWPNAHDLGGLPLNHMVFGEQNHLHLPWTISSSDNHPNAAGHEKIAQYIYDTM